MKTLKQIVNINCVSKTIVTLTKDETEEKYVIKTNRTKFTNASNSIEIEEYNDYYRAQYRFLQLAILYLS